MYLSEQSKTKIRPRDFWIAVLVVTLVLGGAGVYEMQTGHLPTASPGMVMAYHGFEGAFLLFVWMIFFVRSTRKPHQGYTLMNRITLVACTLILAAT